MMTTLAAIVDFILMLFGIYDEHEITVKQCREAQSIGAVPYPMTQEEFERLDKCKAILEGEDE